MNKFDYFFNYSVLKVGCNLQKVHPLKNSLHKRDFPNRFILNVLLFLSLVGWNKIKITC